MLRGTPKFFLRVSQDVFTMQNTQSTKINWKINFILYGLATRKLSVNKKSDTKQPFFPPCRNWPICTIDLLQFNLVARRWEDNEWLSSGLVRLLFAHFQTSERKLQSVSFYIWPFGILWKRKCFELTKCFMKVLQIPSRNSSTCPPYHFLTFPKHISWC